MKNALKIIIFLILFQRQYCHAMQYDENFSKNNLSNFCIKNGVGVLTAKFLQYKGYVIEESFYYKLLVSSLSEITNIIINSEGDNQEYLQYFDEHYRTTFNGFFWIYALEPEIKMILKIAGDMFIDKKPDLQISKKLGFQLGLIATVNVLQKTTILFADALFKK